MLQRLGRYEILERTAAGGQGTVYRAQDTTLDRIVAVKVINQPVTDDPQYLEAQRIPRLQGLEMVQEVEIVEVDIDGRTFWVRPVSPDVLKSRSVVATAIAESLENPFPWAVGFFFGNTELSMELWTVIAGISGIDD